MVTLRADFFDRPLRYPRVGELLAARTEAVPPLSPDELERAIRAPAERAGVSVEPGVVAEIVADVAHEPGALPAGAVRRDGALRAPGGWMAHRRVVRRDRELPGALAERAERVVSDASPDERDAIRQVFLRLVSLGEGREDTRRRVARSELDRLGIDPASDRHDRRTLRASTVAHVRPGPRHAGADRRGRPRSVADGVAAVPAMDRSRSRRPAARGSARTGGRDVGVRRTRSELPAPRCAPRGDRGLDRHDRPLDRDR